MFAPTSRKGKKLNQELYTMQLKELRRLLNDALKEQKQDKHGKLINLLKKEYQMSAPEIEQVIAIVHEKKPEKEPHSLQEKNSQIRNYLELLGLRPRNFDPENLNYTRLKQLVNNRLTKTKKEQTPH